MSQDLKGQVALITGASRGIGKAIALELAGRGAHIAINYVSNEDAAKETAQQLEALGVETLTSCGNVGDPANIKEMVAATAEKWGRIDILVHNAALGAFKPVHKLKKNQWDLSFDVNTKALLLLVQQVLPHMEKQSGGNIITLSSLGAQRFIPNYGAIGISKSALENLVKYLAVELAEKNIRVNCVSGGLVNTDAIKFFPESEKLIDEVKSRTPAGRIAEPEDLAKVVGFLASDASSWIYGQTLIADGGLSLI